MKVLSIILTSALASATLTGAAHAMGNVGDNEYNNFIMKAADSNSDGKLTREEFIKMAANMAAKEFDMMNVNDDDHLNQQEFHSGQR